MRKLVIFLFICWGVIAQAQVSIIKFYFTSDGGYKLSLSQPADFVSNDSVVFFNVADDKTIKVYITDSLVRHSKTLELSLVLHPYSKKVITIEKRKRRLKVGEERDIYFQPPQRCKGSTPTAVVERKIVDLMMIKNDYPRMKDAKKFIREHCLKFIQVKGLIMMFPSDKQRLELAKYAYFFVRDPYNYFLVKDAFANKATYKEFEFFIKNVKRKI